MKYGEKARKLIKAGAAVPFERPWQRREIPTCKEITAFFGILSYGEKHIKHRHLCRIRDHLRCCPVCQTVGGGAIKF